MLKNHLKIARGNAGKNNWAAASFIFRLLVCALAPAISLNAQEKVKNFIFFDRERERIQDAFFLNTQNIEERDCPFKKL